MTLKCGGNNNHQQSCLSKQYTIHKTTRVIALQQIFEPLLPHKYHDHGKQIVIWAMDKEEADEIYHDFIKDLLASNCGSNIKKDIG